VIDPLERLTHKQGPVTVGRAVGDAKRLDPLLVCQQPDRSDPVGAPHAATEAKGIEDAAERVPYVFVGEGLVRQGAGPADFHRDVVVGRQGQQLWQIGERLRRWWRLVRLWQAEVVDHQLRIGIRDASWAAWSRRPVHARLTARECI
jgi:hypothetical protein